MSMMEGAQQHYRLFGARGILLIARSRLLRRPVEVAVSAAGLRNPVYLRLRTSDVSLFEEIIVNSEYAISPPKAPRVIVDAGANIGMTSVFFANAFPQATIIAIEPERSNFEMLEKNAANYPGIRPVQGALWKENVQLNLSDPGTGTWGFQTHALRESDSTLDSVRGITVERLMQEHGCEYIDILKMDIEGSEKEVFESCAPWIDKVGMIIVELHDRSKRGCTRSVYAATHDFELEWCKGETTFFVRRADHSPESFQLGQSATGIYSAPLTKRKTTDSRPRIFRVAN